MEESKERMPETPAEEKKENHPAETKPPAAPLLSREAMSVLNKVLGRLHPAEWAILKNRLKGKARPVPAEDVDLMAVIDDLTTARKVRKEAYEARPKCAECGGGGRLGNHVDEETGKISQYHIQCAGDNRRLTSYQNAQKISEAVKNLVKNDWESVNNALRGILAVTQVENKKRAEDRKDTQKITAEKDALKVKGQIAAAEISVRKKDNPHQSAMGKAMAEAAVAKKK